MKQTVQFFLLIILLIPAVSASIPQTPQELHTLVENILREHGNKPARELALLIAGKDLPGDTDTRSYDMALASMGKLAFVENIGFFKMGNHLTKSGFLVKFTSGALFVEIIGFSSEDGWRIVGYSYQIDSDGLPKIPEVYWKRSE